MPVGPRQPPALLLPRTLVKRFQAAATEDPAFNLVGAGPLGDLTCQRQWAGESLAQSIPEKPLVLSHLASHRVLQPGQSSLAPQIV